MAKQPLLIMKNISKVYGNVCVVEPLQFELQQAGIVALCGGNGAGKSTIIKMITGLIRPTTGSILVNGLDWNRHRIEYAKQIGYMPDDFHLSQPLSVKEYLSFFAALKNASSNVDETLKIVGLNEKKDQLIAKLSKGMRQRLLLGQALVAKPKLILLDEPTNGLDPHWVDTFNEIILATKSLGQGVLFSTHNLAVAEKIADEVCFLKQGAIKDIIKLDQNRDLTNYFRDLFQ